MALVWSGGESITLVIVCVYAVSSAVTYALFAYDKLRAKRGQRRVSEFTLHVFEALGGWPGALLAMRVHRHKSSKWSYRIVCYAIVLAHVGAAGAAWWVWYR